MTLMISQELPMSRESRRKMKEWTCSKISGKNRLNSKRRMLERRMKVRKKGKKERLERPQ